MSGFIKRIFVLLFFIGAVISAFPAESGVPRIRRIIFPNNTFFTINKLKRTIVSANGDFFNKKYIKKDLKNLAELFENKGFDQASFDFKLIQVKSNDDTELVDLQFIIDQGDRSFIRGFVFKGNTVFSADTLRQKMKLKEYSKASDAKSFYTKEKLEAAIQDLEKFYKKKGYINAIVNYETKRIIRSDKLGPKTKIEVSISINEGHKYIFGGMTFQGNTLFSNEELKKAFFISVDAPINEIQLKKGAEIVDFMYNQADRPETKIQTIPQIDEKTHKVTYLIAITETDVSYIEKIEFDIEIMDFREVFKDYIFLRYMQTEVGTIYNTKNIESSIDSVLRNLPSVGSMTYSVEQGSEPGLVTLVFNIDGGKTRNIDFGLGVLPNRWPPDISLYGTFNDYNLFKRSITLKTHLNLSVRNQTLETSINDPAFYNSPFSLGGGIDIAHRWNQFVLRDVSKELPANYKNNIYTEEALREYYSTQSDSSGINPNYLGYEAGFFGMGIHDFYIKLNCNSTYNINHFTSLTFDYTLLPDYYFLPVPYDSKEWHSKIDEVDESIGNLSYFLEQGWILKSTFSLTFKIDTTNNAYFPTKGLLFKITPSYIWGHFDAVNLDANLTYYWRILEAKFGEWKFTPLLVFNAHTSFYFPGFRSLGGNLYNRSTKNSGPIIYEHELLQIDGVFTGRGWANSISAGTDTTRLNDTYGFARFDASIELRIPIHTEIIWLSAFIDVANLVSGPGYYNENGWPQAWRWWDNEDWWGIENWYCSIGTGIQLPLKYLPLSFFVIKRFKINYYSGIEWMYNNYAAANIDFVLSITGYYF